MEEELTDGGQYLFCIDGKWRIGLAEEPDRTLPVEDGGNAWSFVVNGNIHYYDEECSNIIPLSLAIRASELKSDLEVEEKLTEYYADKADDLQAELDMAEKLLNAALDTVKELTAENERLRSGLRAVIDMLGRLAQKPYIVKWAINHALDAMKKGE